MEAKKIVFVDLDGVLADFDKGVYELTGKLPSEQSQQNLWININRAKGFFEDLEWLEDGKKLWSFLIDSGFEPIILTGSTNKKSSKEKQAWCEKNLGADIRVICCKTKEKPQYCVEGSFLIDDRDKVKEEWENQSGIFLHYTGDNMNEIMKMLL
jgi:hypothetical protein